jgi:secreted trypsin-like serine protease
MFIRKPVLIFSALVLSLSAQLAHAGTESTNIIGGTTVSSGSTDGASTVALVITVTKGQAICTGSLLAADIIVTAAHCVTSDTGGTVPAKNIAIVFGQDIRASSRIVVRASGVMKNSKYNPRSGGNDQNDIAIINFAGGLPSGYQKATLLSSKSSIATGSSAVLIGYGVNTMAAGGSGEGILREVTVQVADGNFARTEILLDQRNQKGACHGDSGGPAFARDSSGQLLLWGVTNRGNPDTAPDDCAHYSVYTRISAQAAFVNSASRNLRSKKPSTLARLFHR